MCTLNATPAANRRFTGWYEDDNLIGVANTLTFPVMTDKNIIAKFVTTSGRYIVIPYVSPSFGVDLKPTIVVNGSEIGIGCQIIPKYGSELTFSVTPFYKNFKFKYWLDDDTNEVLSTNPTVNLKVTRDTKIYAVFE